MSKQRDLERERAKFAWDCIGSVKEELRDEYASLAKGAPADIMSNGLGQTLAFWRAKIKDENAHSKLLQHVTDWLSEEKHGFDIKDKKIMGWIMGLEQTNQYRRATAEAIAFLIWVKRFAEAAEKE